MKISTGNYRLVRVVVWSGLSSARRYGRPHQRIPFSRNPGFSNSAGPEQWQDILRSFTSHGSQIVTGMAMVRAEDTLYRYNEGAGHSA